MTDIHDISLLRSIAEQLKGPLTVIARQTELAQIKRLADSKDSDHSQSMKHFLPLIDTQAQIALKLVDMYLLGLDLLDKQTELTLEPVSLASTLYDAAHELSAFTKQYQVELRVAITGRFQPVMAHRQALRALLISLGLTLVEGISTIEQPARRLTFAVQRDTQGLKAGLYGPFALRTEEWRRALQLNPDVRQLLPSVVGATGAGLRVAEILGEAMQSRIYVGRYSRQSGLALRLLSSHQLQLV